MRVWISSRALVRVLILSRTRYPNMQRPHYPGACLDSHQPYARLDFKSRVLSPHAAILPLCAFGFPVARAAHKQVTLPLCAFGFQVARNVPTCSRNNLMRAWISSCARCPHMHLYARLDLKSRALSPHAAILSSCAFGFQVACVVPACRHITLICGWISSRARVHMYLWYT